MDVTDAKKNLLLTMMRGRAEAEAQSYCHCSSSLFSETINLNQCMQ